jgi:hypothetical protein
MRAVEEASVRGRQPKHESSVLFGPDQKALGNDNVIKPHHH